MREEVLATVFRGDETKAFCVVKPFYCSVCHLMLLIAGDISPTALMVAGTQTVKWKIQRMIERPSRKGAPLKSDP
jgi:hypothetical protein